MRRTKQQALRVVIIAIFKLCRNHPLFSLLFFLIAVGWYGYEIKIARPALSYAGVPYTTDWQNPMHWFRVLRNDNFMLGYSDLRGNPLWVVYKISPVANDAPFLKRPQGFDKDWRTLNPVTHADYLKSGYDRGHMAPNYAISRLYGKDAQLDTFLMSNITPQKPDLNRKLWQRLEEVEIDFFSKLNKETWVYTGPVFQNSIERLSSAWNVQIPDAFYKIYVQPTPSGTPQALAFLMPQTVKGNEPLTQFVTSIDQIESLTGLDFFAELDDKLENTMEASAETQAWQLNKVARRASRY